MQARAVRAACRAARSRLGRLVLLCGHGCCCSGMRAATLATSGARAVESARAVVAWCARWVPGRGEAGFLSAGGGLRRCSGGVRAVPLFLCSIGCAGWWRGSSERVLCQQRGGALEGLV